jgi:protein-tyrosine-phosphatase
MKEKYKQLIPSGFSYLETSLDNFFKKYAHYNRNVFVMMPFATSASDQIFHTVADELDKHGLIALRADKSTFAPDSIWWNIATYMIGCTYGLVIYEPNNDIPFNPNVSIEAGFMLALDRQVLFLVNDKVKYLPVDFAGRIFKCYNSTPDQLETSLRSQISDWILNTISHYDYDVNNCNKQLILFASRGGTCRCAIGKAILSDILHKEKFSSVAVADAAAFADPHQDTVSKLAVQALTEIGCDSWIEKHRPRKLSRFLEERASLIIAIDNKSYGRNLTRAITDNELFGETIANPYRKPLEEYQKVCKQLSRLLSENLDKILKMAEVE